MAAGVSHGREAYGFGLNGDRLISQGSVVGWVDCGSVINGWGLEALRTQ